MLVWITITSKYKCWWISKLMIHYKTLGAFFIEHVDSNILWILFSYMKGPWNELWIWKEIWSLNLKFVTFISFNRNLGSFPHPIVNATMRSLWVSSDINTPVTCLFIGSIWSDCNWHTLYHISVKWLFGLWPSILTKAMIHTSVHQSETNDSIINELPYMFPAFANNAMTLWLGILSEWKSKQYSLSIKKFQKTKWMRSYKYTRLHKILYIV